MIIWLWIGFLALITGLLALDLGVFHRKMQTPGIREAIGWSLFWIFLALMFNVLIYYLYESHFLGIGTQIGHELSGEKAAIQFLTGYVIEKSLSLDNIFVIALIFSYFGIPEIYQHRVLFWGILGALVMRGAMILAGTVLIQKFFWMTYVFGGFLIFTAIKMLIDRHDNLEPDKNLFVRCLRRFYPVTKELHGKHFWIRQKGVYTMTPLFVALIVVEGSDLLFAVDSIPAIFSVTREPFLVFTSNIFAILGLRSLYFALAAMIEKFRYLKISLVFILVYVGIKMLLIHHFAIPAWVSLCMIGGILMVGVLASLTGGHRDTAKLPSPLKK